MLLRIVRAVRLNLRYAEEDTLRIRLSEADQGPKAYKDP